MEEQEFYMQEPTCEGTIEEVVYRNEDNGYSVVELIDNKTLQLVTAVGTLPFVVEGELVSFWGEWVDHPDYGKQLKVTGYQKKLPTAIQDILKYLSSKTIKGVGPQTALKIVSRFGLDTFDVIEYHPEWLADITGITRKKAATIHNSFMEQAEVRNLMLLCAGHIAPPVISRIFDMWGNEATSILRRNPYRLCQDMDGIPFSKADEVAQTLGIEKDSINRVKAGLDYLLTSHAASDGHVCFPKKELFEEAIQLLDLDETVFSERFQALLKKGEFVYFAKENTTYVYTKVSYEQESYIASKLIKLLKDGNPFSKAHLVRLIEEMESEWGIVYNRDQLKAIEMALTSGAMILTGGPGTGKTTVIRALLHIFSLQGLKIALCAPTGRAAKRMSEATVSSARTIHRLLEMTKADEKKAKFMKDEENPLDEQVVIVDETSMIDMPLMYHLLKAIKRGTRLILVGDANQLPSVGAGNILMDLLSSGKIPSVCLEEIFRQAKESLIVTNAHRIHLGEMPVLDDTTSDFFFMKRSYEESIPTTIESLVTERLPKAYGEQIREGIQILCPTRKGKAGTEAINKLLQSKLNPKDEKKKEIQKAGVIFREGDRIMQIKNDYDVEWIRGGKHHGMGIFNGEIGILYEIDIELEICTLVFEDKVCEYKFSMLEEIEHSYAITVHKSQGSEYPCVIFALGYAGPMLQTRNLLYTGITRAKEKLILVGRKDVLENMVKNDFEEKRFTGLKERIEREYSVFYS